MSPLIQPGATMPGAAEGGAATRSGLPQGSSPSFDAYSMSAEGPDSVVTPGLVRASSTSSLPGNRFTLLPNVAGMISVDRPSVVSALDVTDGKLLFQYRRRSLDEEEMQVATKGGKCLLGGKGDWWFLYKGSNAIDMLTIESWWPTTAAGYIAEGGCSRITMTSTLVSSHLASVEILAANRHRVAALIQNVRVAGANTNVVRISIDQAASVLDTAAPNDRGFMLGTAASITLSGETLSRGSIRAILEANIAPNQARMEVTEFRND